MWVLYGLLSGLFYALGNVAYGINCSQLGVASMGFLGPSTLFIVLIYRFVGFYHTKKDTGQWIDKANSNYWQLTVSDDNDDSQYRFNWGNLNTVVLTQAMPSSVGMLLVSYAFNFALLAEVN